MFEVLDLRERLIVKLAVIGGMRCSEIFGLRISRVKGDYLEIAERCSRRDIDTPKTAKSVRTVALAALESRRDAVTQLESSLVN